MKQDIHSTARLGLICCADNKNAVHSVVGLLSVKPESSHASFNLIHAGPTHFRGWWVTPGKSGRFV